MSEIAIPVPIPPPAEPAPKRAKKPKKPVLPPAEPSAAVEAVTELGAKPPVPAKRKGKAAKTKKPAPKKPAAKKTAAKKKTAGKRRKAPRVIVNHRANTAGARFTPSERAKIVARYVRGDSVAMLRAQYKLTPHVLIRMVRNAGETVRGRGRPPTKKGAA